MEIYSNSLLSWQIIQNKRKWFGRCIEKDYLSLKCHLLERFMHDLLFESVSVDIIIEFLGLHNILNDTNIKSLLLEQK